MTDPGHDGGRYVRTVSAERFFSSTCAERRAVPLPPADAEYAGLPAPYLARVDNVTLVPADWLLISAHDDLLVETLHHVPVPKLGRFAAVQEVAGQVVKLRPPSREDSIAEPCILLGGHWSHYHWLVDYLPRVFAAGQFADLRDLRFLVSRNLAPAQRQSLLLAGVGEERLLPLDDDAFYRIATLWVPSIFSRTGIVHPLVPRWLRQTYSDALGSTGPRLRLFVSRRDAARRKLLNETEISAILEPLGFQTIVPGELSFEDQVRTFARAEAIVAVTGSGLSNCVFAPRGCDVIELLNSADLSTNTFNRNLALLAGHRHRWFPGQPVFCEGELPHNWDFRIEPDSFKMEMSRNRG